MVHLVTQRHAKGYWYFDNKIRYLSTQYAEHKVHEIRNQPLTWLIFGTLTAFGLRLKNPQCFGEHVCLQVQSTAEEPILVDPLDRVTVYHW